MVSMPHKIISLAEGHRGRGEMIGRPLSTFTRIFETLVSDPPRAKGQRAGITRLSSASEVWSSWRHGELSRICTLGRWDSQSLVEGSIYSRRSIKPLSGVRCRGEGGPNIVLSGRLNELVIPLPLEDEGEGCVYIPRSQGTNCVKCLKSINYAF